MKFSEPHFQSETEAGRYFEAIRWPDGRVCPTCGQIGGEYETKREGRYRCGAKECRKDFTVKTKTVMESSHIKLTVWLMAYYMMASSKKGVSAHQLHRTLDVTYKTAWFLAHRIRYAMANDGLLGPLGGEGKIVEADETYFGSVANPNTMRADGMPYAADVAKASGGKGKGRGPANKRAVVALVERGGKARVFHVAEANRETIEKILHANVDPASRLHTDESHLYKRFGERFAAHETTTHSKGEYARGDVHNNSAESLFGVFKRGMKGVYQHCSEKHLHRYLSEFEFRHNNRVALGVGDAQRARAIMKGADGKRLTYRRTDGTQPTA